MGRGRFITLEGGEGAGKSTQVRCLVEHLAQHGIKALATREVGGCAGAEDIRRLWLSQHEGFWDPLTEVLLIMAARREHLTKTVWPALEAGVWVISDRFVDSTRAYQGIGLGLGVERIDALYHQIAGDFWPDLTLVLDLPVDVGLQRMKARSGAAQDRYEQQDTAFHDVLRQAFLTLAAQEPQRIEVINAAEAQASVTHPIAARMDQLIESGMK